MSLGRISFAWFGLFLPLLGFSACSSGDSGSNAHTHTGDLPEGSAGTLALGGSSATGGSKSANAGAGSAGVAGAFAQAGAAGNAGSAGNDLPSNAGGASGAGSGGFVGVSGSATSAGANSVGGSHSGGSAGAAGSSAAFAKVSSILGSNCGIKGCHADKETPHFVPGPMLYATLTGPNTVLAECGYTKFVEPFDPAKSALVRLMNRQCDGFTMPPSCNKTTCLAAADLQALSDWIQAGAPP